MAFCKNCDTAYWSAEKTHTCYEWRVRVHDADASRYTHYVENEAGEEVEEAWQTTVFGIDPDHAVERAVLEMADVKYLLDLCGDYGMYEEVIIAFVVDRLDEPEKVHYRLSGVELAPKIYVSRACSCGRRIWFYDDPDQCFYCREEKEKEAHVEAN